jgi:Tol biopolymer transport system component
MSSQPLRPGARIGPYEVVSPLGAGGMGEVWRARDPRLGRDVAIKVLPASFAESAERRARFAREARLLAALNHPHVGGIYGVEDASGTPALVLELVEGLSLSELLDRGRGQPLPLAQAVTIAGQIAHALEAAHDKGIIHRDLKPANVKITPDGVVKVLDFGLGLDTSASADASSSRDPTATSDRSVPGTTLGTAAYMSPEQARGAAVDRRTDVWAFGCVLYEMLTGSRTFAADTFSDTLALVITREPDWARLPPSTPPGVRRLLKRCLQKDLKRRVRDVGDARLELEEATAVDEAPSAASVHEARPDVRLMRLTDSVGMAGAPAISPDGKMVAFVAVAGGRRQIFVRLLAGGAPLQVTRDDSDHEAPRWLPDSSAIVYYAPILGRTMGNLWMVSALGGPARRIAAAVGGGDVSHDGRRLAFFRAAAGGLALTIAGLDGSETRTVLEGSSQLWFDQPRWSPDDRELAFNRTGTFFDNSIQAVGVEGGEPRTLARGFWMRGLAWQPDGSGLVYSSSAGSTLAYPPTNNLRSVGRDGTRDRQVTFGDVSYFEPDVDGAGRVVASRVRSRSDVWRFPIDGTPEENARAAVRITRQTGQIQVPSLSPDGHEMVYVSDSGGHSNLWVAAVDGSSLQQLTFETDPEVAVAVPAWSPAGDQILFVRSHDARLDVCLVGRDGGGVATLVPDAFGYCWSSDGRAVYCSRLDGRIDRVDLATGAAATVRTDRARGPAVAPDGTLFFTRIPELALGLGDDCEICRASPDEGPAEVLARVACSRVPLAPRLQLHVFVSPDGRWLAFPLLDGTSANLWLLPTAGGPPRAITDFADRSVMIVRQVSWAPDGRHLYAAVAETDADIVLLERALAP